MQDIFYVAIVIFIIICIGGGIGFWLWYVLKRKNVESWNAEVFKLGKGVQPPITSKGKVIANLRLCDLVPYRKDVIVKREGKGSSNSYMLKILKKAVPEVTASVVTKWGDKDRRVAVLLEGGCCTLLEKGYDKKIAKEIYIPMTYDRVTMIKTEMQERKDKIEQRKDAMQQIAAWVVVGFWVIGLVATTYFFVNGYIKMSQENTKSAKYIADAQLESAKIFREIYVDMNFERYRIDQEDPPNATVT